MNTCSHIRSRIRSRVASDNQKSIRYREHQRPVSIGSRMPLLEKHPYSFAIQSLWIFLREVTWQMQETDGSPDRMLVSEHQRPDLTVGEICLSQSSSLADALGTRMFSGVNAKAYSREVKSLSNVICLSQSDLLKSVSAPASAPESIRSRDSD